MQPWTFKTLTEPKAVKADKRKALLEKLTKEERELLGV